MNDKTQYQIIKNDTLILVDKKNIFNNKTWLSNKQDVINNMFIRDKSFENSQNITNWNATSISVII